MQTLFKAGERVPLPESVGVCPDCDGKIFLDCFDDFAPFVEEANLYAPHVVAGLICENDCDQFDDPAPENENKTSKQRYETAEERDQAWEGLYDKVHEWLRGMPFLVDFSDSVKCRRCRWKPSSSVN